MVVVVDVAIVVAIVVEVLDVNVSVTVTLTVVVLKTVLVNNVAVGLRLYACGLHGSTARFLMC